jgi:hypothetical protein
MLSTSAKSGVLCNGSPNRRTAILPVMSDAVWIDFYQGTDYQLIWVPEIEVDVTVVTSDP